MIYDILIIGSGIVGNMVARELSQKKLKILVIDKKENVLTPFNVDTCTINNLSKNIEDNIDLEKFFIDLSYELNFDYKKETNHGNFLSFSPSKLLSSLIKTNEINKIKYFYKTKVLHIEKYQDLYTIFTNNSENTEILAKYIINCSGSSHKKISEMLNLNSHNKIFNNNFSIEVNTQNNFIDISNINSFGITLSPFIAKKIAKIIKNAPF